MSSAETQPTIPDVRLERYRLGELPPDEMRAIAERAASDAALQRRLSALEQSDLDVAGAYPPRTMAAAIRRRGLEQGERTGREGRLVGARRPWPVMAGVAVTCLCVVAVSVSVWRGRPAGDDTTLKSGGRASLVLHRRVAGGSEELQPGALVRAGDQVRLGYRASDHTFGTILSIDGRGTLTQHLPLSGDRAAALRPSGTVFLDTSYELDDAPRWEMFYFVTSDTPFELESVRRAVRSAGAVREGYPGPLSLPAGLQQFPFRLTKVQP